MSEATIILLMILAIAMTIASYVIASFGLTLFFGAPYVGTPKSVAREMMQLAQFQPGEIFMDLGSGSGTMLIVAVKEFGASRAIGYEINPILVWWTRWRILKSGLRGKIEVRTANFFTCKLAEADVVGLYLLDNTMDRILPRLHESLRLGGRAVSRGFQFKDVSPVEKRKTSLAELYLYRL